jgi:hypothetical protein
MDAPTGDVMAIAVVPANTLSTLFVIADEYDARQAPA